MDATAESTEDGWTLVLVRELKHPPARVWTALTEPAELAGWAPFTAERALTRTGGLTLTMIDGDQHVDIASTVTAVEPPRLLEYRWGGDRLRWELESRSAAAPGSPCAISSPPGRISRRPQPAGTSASTLPSGCSTATRWSRSAAGPRWTTAGSACTTTTRSGSVEADQVGTAAARCRRPSRNASP